MKLPRLIVALGVLTGLAFSSGQLLAASSSVFTGGLRLPSKIAYSTKGNLLVAESGFGQNNGRVSLVDPVTGVRRSLLDGLPSGLSIPDNAPSGPSGLAMRGRTLYISIGLGDAVVNGPANGTQVPNPDISSPIFASVLAVHFSAAVEQSTTGFTLTHADHWALANGNVVEFDAGRGEKMTVELVANFPDFVPEPTAAVPANVRQSNPFGVAIIGDMLYVPDASSNCVRTVDLATGDIAIMTRFEPLLNTRGFGPPRVEAVPDSIHVSGNQLLVTLLSGFPFPIGQAQVRTVDASTGASAPLITGLTSAIDVLAVNGGFYTLEFSGDMLANAPGRIRWFASASATPTLVFGALATPTAMVRDAKTGALFVTQIFSGQVVKVTP